MKIIADAQGGDHAPLEVVKGCIAARDEYGVDIVLVGKEQEIRQVLRQENLSDDRIEIVDAPDVITMEDDPSDIARGKKDSSMAVGLRLLRDGAGDAFISGGNTGALLAGGTLIVKRIRGIRRAALATILPRAGGVTMLLDSGANTEWTPEHLAQFGILGSLYMEKVMGIQSPRVGLVNNGSEETKGGADRVAAYQLLKQAPVNFVGNVEAREIPMGGCDVAVTDGFTGNIVLKLVEGLAAFFMGEIKGMLLRDTKSKIAAAILKPGLVEFKRKLDYTETGGAPLMGLCKPVIKAHGSSNAKAYKNAVRQAISFANSGMIQAMEAALSANPVPAAEELPVP
jgi:glycerol-3-phosphate acyltransferase PlsX